MPRGDSEKTLPPLGPLDLTIVPTPSTRNAAASWGADECSTRPEAEEHVSPSLCTDRAALPRSFGRYRLEKQLGRGGMGVVYQAIDTKLGRTVALKIPLFSGPCSPSLRSRFLREAEAAAILAHPNICPIHDLGEISGVPFLVMPFIQGEPLTRQIQAAPVEVLQALVVVRKVALALQAAHDRGVIHRDLKPSNIMIDERGEPVIMDFGLARRQDLTAITNEGEAIGTPAYMPPEQISGDIKAMGPACDIYSLGVVLFELLTGRRPFQGIPFALLRQNSTDAPPKPSAHRAGLDSRLDEICLKAMAKQPADRWQSMSELADRLNQLLVSTPSVQSTCPVLPAAAATAQTAPLALWILGTPFAYRPAPGQDVIRLGRQRPKPGTPVDQGNDMVLRVPGNDGLCARISRRHLEIHRLRDGHVVIDRSKTGTLHNGNPLTRDVAVPLAAGDRLVIAGVLTLEVLLQTASTWRVTAGELEAMPLDAGAAVVLEATLGDMLTAE